MLYPEVTPLEYETLTKAGVSISYNSKDLLVLIILGTWQDFSELPFNFVMHHELSVNG